MNILTEAEVAAHVAAHQVAQSNHDRFAMVLAKHYAVLFANDPNYAAIDKRTTPAELARKMTNGLAVTGADKDGRGVVLTCKELGIKHTYKAIRAYLQGAA